MRPSRQHSRRGFTLVELVGVVIVLGVMAGAAIPALRGMDRASERADREAAASTLRVARALAVASGAPHAAAFEPSGVVRVERWRDGDAEPAVGPMGEVVRVTRTSDDPATRVGGDAIAGDSLRVWFGARGAPLAAGSDPQSGALSAEAITIVFSSGAQLEVEAQTGGVRWSDAP
jgi:prepilin-type N-terminal cleavage/methylation domain-containing protein